jgi:hypothetical protein
MLKRLSLALAGLFVLSAQCFAAGTIPYSLSQQFDKYGHVLAGCKLNIIQAGTVGTPQTAYQDSALTIPVPGGSLLTCDAAGRLPQFFLADGSVKILLTDVNGVTQVSADGILVVGASSGGGGGSPVDPTTVLQTGWLQPIYGSGVVTGFVRANGRTIGSATSGASERANSDTQALFLWLWGADANLAVSTGRGASAAADWAANKTIALPDWRGRALAGLDDMGNSAAGRLTATYFGTAATALGAAGGAESQTLSLAQLPTGITSTGTLTVGGTSNGALSFMTADQQGTVITINSGATVSFKAILNAGTSLTQSASATGTLTSNNTSGSAHPIASPMMLATIYLKL